MLRLITAAIAAAIFLLVVHSVNAQQPRNNVATLPLSTPEEIYVALFRAFTFVADEAQYGMEEDQRTHADAVRQGKKFRDDCDGFAITARDLLQSAGIPAWLVIVRNRKNLTVNDNGRHMFTAFRDPKDGVIKTLDNRYVYIRTYENTISGSMYRNPIEIEKPFK